MKKTLVVLMVASALTGCSTMNSMNPFKDTPPAGAVSLKQHEAEFIKKYGTLKVKFDDSGNFVELTSTGMAYVESDSPAGKTGALNLASMRAKNNVAEFIKTDISSKKFANVITKSVQGDGTQKADQADTIEMEKGSVIAGQIREQITEQSSAILRGTTVTKRNVDMDTGVVSVEITISRLSILSANNLSNVMEGRK